MNKNLAIISKLLNDFSNFIDNRSTIFLVVYDEVFPKILEWHFSIWEKQYLLLGEEDKINEWGIYINISQSLNSIFRKIEEKSFKEDFSYHFFSSLKKHLDKHQNKFINKNNGKKYYYTSSIIPIFYSAFVENIKNSSRRYDIWEHYFPREWKITQENLESKDNRISIELLNNFQEWAQNRFLSSEHANQYDEILEEMSSNLFPTVDPILWSKILTLLFRPWADDNRMLSLVSKGTNFGYTGRVYVSSVSSEEDMTSNWAKQMRSQEEATLKLALFLFRNYLTQNNLKKFIRELKNLKLEEGSKEEVRRKQYIQIFESMIHILESSSKSKNINKTS